MTAIGGVGPSDPKRLGSGSGDGAPREEKEPIINIQTGKVEKLDTFGTLPDNGLLPLPNPNEKPKFNSYDPKDNGLLPLPKPGEKPKLEKLPYLEKPSEKPKFDSYNPKNNGLLPLPNPNEKPRFNSYDPKDNGLLPLPKPGEKPTLIPLSNSNKEISEG